MASQRKFAPALVERVVEHFDYLPASIVRKIVERVRYEMWLAEIAKNPAVVALAALKPGGKGIPWDRAQKRHGPGFAGRVYLQSADVERARALLNDPEARWHVYFSKQRLSAGHDSDVMVRRIR